MKPAEKRRAPIPQGLVKAIAALGDSIDKTAGSGESQEEKQ